MTMLRYLYSEVLFDPLYEFKDGIKLSEQAQAWYAMKPGITTSDQVYVYAHQSMMEVYCCLYDIINNMEKGDEHSQEAV